MVQPKRRTRGTGQLMWRDWRGGGEHRGAEFSTILLMPLSPACPGLLLPMFEPEAKRMVTEGPCTGIVHILEKETISGHSSTSKRAENFATEVSGNGRIARPSWEIITLALSLVTLSSSS